jgi:hypothetical protein
MNSVISHHWPLDWVAFWANNKAQPLHVVVSGLLTMDSRTLTSEKGHFESLPELARCMRASMVSLFRFLCYLRRVAATCVPSCACDTVLCFPLLYLYRRRSSSTRCFAQ